MDVLDPRGSFFSCLCVTSDWLCTTVQFGQAAKYFAPPVVAASPIIIIVISSSSDCCSSRHPSLDLSGAAVFVENLGW